jgi:ribonuclease HI
MIIYYTDGSASPNPGPGGFSVIKNGVPHILGSEDGDTTNIRMEGKAILAALKDYQMGTRLGSERLEKEGWRD